MKAHKDNAHPCTIELSDGTSVVPTDDRLSPSY
jgi:hypothetical protein